MPEHILPKPTKLEEKMGMWVADDWIRTWRLPVLPLIWFGGKRRKQMGQQIAVVMATGRHLENARMRERLEKTCCE